LTVLLHCFNEAPCLGSLVVQANVLARRYTSDYEILVADDGSTDGTPGLLEQLKATTPNLRWICHPSTRGPGAAVRSGLAVASKEWIFTSDADGQYDLEELGLLVEKVGEGLGAVCGFRSVRTDSVIRRVVSKAYLFLLRSCMGIRTADFKCAFRLIRRNALDSVPLLSDTGLLWVELTKRLEERGCRTTHVPVHVYPRRYGRSRALTPRLLLKAVVEHLRLWRDLKRA